MARASASSLAFLTGMGGRGDDGTLAGASRGTTSLNLADQPNPVGNLLIVDEPAGSGEKDDEGLLEVSEDEEDIPPSCVHHVYNP